MSTLFSPFEPRSITFRNRIFVSPMCQYSSDNGLPNNWHLVHLGSRAVGGAALAMRAEWPPELPLFVRISATEWMAGGWDFEQSVSLSRQLKVIGVDLIDCSSGLVVPDEPGPLWPRFSGPLGRQGEGRGGDCQWRRGPDHRAGPGGTDRGHRSGRCRIPGPTAAARPLLAAPCRQGVKCGPALTQPIPAGQTKEN